MSGGKLSRGGQELPDGDVVVLCVFLLAAVVMVLGCD